MRPAPRHPKYDQERSGAVVVVVVVVTIAMADILEIVGLYSDTNGRSCSVHAICGDHVNVGDVLRLVATVVDYKGSLEPAVKCVKVVDGTDACTVAFVPRNLSDLPKVKEHLNKFVQVTELYAESKNTYKRSKAKANYGVAAVRLLSEEKGRDE